MVAFLIFVMIGVLVGMIRTRNERDGYWTKNRVMILCVMSGILLGVGASVLGGSFVKKEIIAKKYVISPMIFDGKIIAGLVEFPSYYTLQIKEGDKTRLIKHNLSKEEIFFTLNEGKERYLEIKRSRTCRRNMWIWFFFNTGLIESKVVLKKGDSFLILPRYYSSL